MAPDGSRERDAMTDTPDTERLIDAVELVRSRGDPARSKLCVMSLVARLAAEPHGDRPVCASPVIAAFARPVNDAMDRTTRQRLRPFAPRLVGTADGCDGKRRDLLHAFLLHTLLPAIVTDLQAGAGSHDEAGAAALASELTGHLVHAEDAERLRLAQDPAWDRAALIWPLRTALAARRDGDGVQQAEAIARVLIAAVSGVARPSRRAWYWDRAVAILDALAEAGRPEPTVPAPRHAARTPA
jgi:hypothetical protein